MRETPPAPTSVAASFGACMCAAGRRRSRESNIQTSVFSPRLECITLCALNKLCMSCQASRPCESRERRTWTGGFVPLNLCPQPMLCECEPFDEWCALHGRVVLSCVGTVVCRAAVRAGGCLCALPVWNVTAFRSVFPYLFMSSQMPSPSSFADLPLVLELSIAFVQRHCINGVSSAENFHSFINYHYMFSCLCLMVINHTVPYRIPGGRIIGWVASTAIYALWG